MRLLLLRPAVGDTRFKARLERELGVYVHVGAELALEHRVSLYLKAETLDLACFHNLEVHLHLLDGYQGRGREFRLCGRDPALATPRRGHGYWCRQKNGRRNGG